MFAVQAEGADVLTIEGIAAADGTLHALQEGFREMHGLQCGFCTPGMIVRAYRLLQENPVPTRSGNPHRHFRQSLPLHGLSEHRQGDSVRRRQAQWRTNSGKPPNERSDRSHPRSNAPKSCKAWAASASGSKTCDSPRASGKYVDDIKLPGMLHGDFHRSSHAHARIVKIDTSKAKAVPGVVAVLTAEDLKGVNLAWMPTLAGDVQMVLADGKVLFQNQEIAFVVATDRYIAADAADLVEVEYEPLPVLVDPFKAMDAGCAGAARGHQGQDRRRAWAAQASTTTSSTGRSATAN